MFEKKICMKCASGFKNNLRYVKEKKEENKIHDIFILYKFMNEFFFYNDQNGSILENRN